jgi:hypothetical protein
LQLRFCGSLGCLLLKLLQLGLQGGNLLVLQAEYFL